MSSSAGRRRPATAPRVSAFVAAMRADGGRAPGAHLLHQRRRPGPHRPALRRSGISRRAAAARPRPKTIAQLLDAACRADAEAFFRSRGRTARPQPHLRAVAHLHDARSHAAQARRTAALRPGRRARRHRRASASPAWRFIATQQTSIRRPHRLRRRDARPAIRSGASPCGPCRARSGGGRRSPGATIVASGAARTAGNSTRSPIAMLRS